jgi:WD40 repeat protein
LAKAAREELRAGHLVTAIQLALRGLPSDKPSEKRPLVAETLGSLIEGVNGGKEGRILRGHSGAVSSTAFSPDGKYVTTTSSDKTSRLWDVATGSEIRSFGGAGYFYALVVTFSPDGKRVLTASDDKIARLWDVATGSCLAILKHADRISSAFSPDGMRVLTASSDKTARV